MNDATDNTIGKFAWHIHHSNYKLEVLTEPIEVRKEYIRNCKPSCEVDTRLRLLKVVQGTPPQMLVEAHDTLTEARKAYDKAYDKAYKVFGKACDTLTKACKAYDKVYRACSKEIDALHKLECPDCPWDEKQKTIFPTEEVAT